LSTFFDPQITQISPISREPKRTNPKRVDFRGLSGQFGAWYSLAAMSEPDAGFEIFDVTADKGIRAWGEDPATVFEEAARALWSLMIVPAGVKAQRAVRVAVEASDSEALLVAWLNELLYLYETQWLIGADCRVLSWTETHLDAEVRGETVDRRRHTVVGHVKAATYHQLHLGQTAGRWEARVVVDV
jgi:SHS2 domain-containing protein